MRPTDKLVAGTSVGAIVAIIVWLAGMRGLEVPPNIQDSLEILLSLLLPLITGAITAYLTREKHPAQSARETIDKES